jgi:hypothetical protein
MCSYTLKGGNYRSNGFPEDQIKEWYEKSFQKEAGREVSKEIFAYLDKKIRYKKDYELNGDETIKCIYPGSHAQNLFKDVQREIISYLINEEVQIGTPKPFVSRHAYLWIQNTKTIKKSDKINILCYLII